MRNILFRGKRLDNGEWMYGDLIENQGRFFIYHATSETTIEDNDDRRIVVAAFEVDPATVGQYTGLKDKKWTMIFEGDILLLSDGKSHSEDVVVEHGLYGWTFYNPQTATFYSDGSHTYIAVENCRFMFGTGVVIGNIHDDPDLLK